MAELPGALDIVCHGKRSDSRRTDPSHHRRDVSSTSGTRLRIPRTSLGQCDLGPPPAHLAQLRNYLRASGLTVGLLVNFGLEPEFQRLINASAPGLDLESPLHRRDG